MLKWLCLAAVIAAAPVTAAQAALPPDAQNSDDLDAMIAFVHENPTVLRTLRVIDVENLSVHWGEDCTAYFGRNAKENAEPMPGPLPPLVFDHATCPID